MINHGDVARISTRHGGMIQCPPAGGSLQHGFALAVQDCNMISEEKAAGPAQLSRLAQATAVLIRVS